MYTIIIINSIVRAFINAQAATAAFLRVDDYQSVFPGINGAFHRADINTGGIFAMLAGHENISHLDFRYRSSFMLDQFAPKMPGQRLRHSIRSPIVAAVFILAG
jgi:hypothetical protein